MDQLRAGRAAELHSITHAQSKLILSSRFALLSVILKNIFAAFECDSQERILIRQCSVFTPIFRSLVI